MTIFIFTFITITIIICVDPHTIVGKAGDLLNKHFAARSAIRDFNQTMPMVLPTGFEMHRYCIVYLVFCMFVCG